MKHRFLSQTFIFLIVSSICAQSMNLYNASEIKLAMKRLNVLGSVLYIAAHPDDENTALLAALAQDRCYRTAYLSITRGEGGQNLLGPEQGEILGLIRTQELLAARRIDGAEQFFTNAVDFGFSKTSEETLRFWGKEKTLADVVWIIRKFRPDVIVTRFTPLLGGHGNHTASAILAIEAFHAAADPKRFPEQLQYVPPWQAKRIVFNLFRQPQNEQVQSIQPLVSMDAGAYSPLLGKSFTEIAGEARSMHKSQGMGSGLNRGEFLNYFQHTAGDTAKKDLFDGIDAGWSRIQDAGGIGRILDDAYRTFDDSAPARSIPLLFKALSRINALTQDSWTGIKKEEISQVILACAGLWIDATTSDNFKVPGNEVKINTTIINRSEYPFVLDSISLPFGGTDTLFNKRLESNRTLRENITLRLPEQISCSQPYWLIRKPDVGSYNISNILHTGQPENTPPVMISFWLSSPDGNLRINLPVVHKVIDPVDGELLRPFVIVPPVIINTQESVVLFPNMPEQQLHINLKSETANARGTVRLNLPENWSAAPSQYEFEFQNSSDEQTFTFNVHPFNGAKSGTFAVEVRTGKTTVNRSMQTIQYRHIPAQTIFPIAEGKLLRMDLKKIGQNVGYIMGAGDEMPAAIRQMGYSVALISDEELADGNLGRYDVIVAGVRAYNTRPKLKIFKQRLMEYVKQGGTYIVQYFTPQRNESEDIGPYPINISRDRVSEEDAQITFPNRNHRLLTTPNIISQDDFNNWIQERGLYFADRWDARYDSVFACHDSGEPGRAGGLLSTQHGKGFFVFCAYSFFRQLPAGVEGAYRLFANILSLQADHKQNPAVKPETSSKRK